MSWKILKKYDDELMNIYRNAPVFAGDTISHEGAKQLFLAGYTTRDINNEHVPTAKG